MKHIYTLFLFAFLGFNSSIIAQTIWTGDDLTFDKAGDADWTLEENQDRITDNVWLTRQNSSAVYNYKWWQDNFSTDATYEDLFADFWDDIPIQSFTPTGGTKGLRWCIIDDTGSMSDWSSFSFYGTLGNPSNFYSFHNIASIITQLEQGQAITSIDNDFGINGEGNSGTVMTTLVGKKLGVWIVDEDIYFTLTFNTWGSGGSGGALSYTRSTDQTLSINNFELASSIQLYPNPANHTVSINTAVKNVTVTDVTGKQVMTTTQNSFNIVALNNGVYFVKVEDLNGNTTVKRLIKK